jgi:hypothetical protein
MYKYLQPDETFLGQPNPWPGWLPDDIRIEGGNFRFYFPLVMCLLFCGRLQPFTAPKAAKQAFLCRTSTCENPT